VVDDLGSALDGVAWEIEPDAERAIGDLSPLAAEVLFGAAREAIRNAVRHARPLDRSRPLHLGIAIAVTADELTLHVEDDGVGVAGGQGARSEPGGAGQGLILHGTLLTVLGGSLAIDSLPGQGTRVTLRVPIDEDRSPPAPVHPTLEPLQSTSHGVRPSLRPHGPTTPRPHGPQGERGAEGVS
jgi:signal transduction histidine kinase